MVQARLQALVLELHAAICLQGVSQAGFPQAGEVPMVQASLQVFVLELYAAICLQGVSQVGFPQAVKVHFQVFSRGPVVVVCLSVVPRPVA